MLDVIVFGELIKRKRGEAKLSQEKLASRIWNDPARKGDISRLERGLVAKPQEKTIQYLCTALNISPAEMEPIRQSRLSATQLDQIPTLSREELENIGTRFQIEDVFDRTDADLRQLLTKKATEYRALKAEVDAIPNTMRKLSNLKAAAQDAIARVDLDEVEHLMTLVHTTELEEAAKSAEIRADNALLRGDVDHAYALLNSAADSFSVVDRMEPTRRRVIEISEKLYDHGDRYGGTAMRAAEKTLREAMNEELRNEDSALWANSQVRLGNVVQKQGLRVEGEEGTQLLGEAVQLYQDAAAFYKQTKEHVHWATTQNNLGNALKNQGTRTQGSARADLLAQAVTAYCNALEVRTREGHPVDWAMTQNNLGATLQDQGIRTEGSAGADLLAEAVTAYRNTLQVYTRADHPVHWATTQNNLGIALSQQGIRTEGSAGADLLAQAVTAYRNALEVRTREGHPVQWAETKLNIAIALKDQATHDSCTDPARALTEALAAVDAALTVFDPDHMSYNHGTATRLRDDIRAAIDARA